jgi:hypothetical protein
MKASQITCIALGVEILGTCFVLLATSPMQVGPPGDTVQAAADKLLSLVVPPNAENSYFPQFAREKLTWIEAQYKAEKLRVAVLDDLSKTNLNSTALMAAGILDGRPTIIIPRERFDRWLNDTGRRVPPFTRQQRNDFMLGLVHEAVHLQNPRAGSPTNPDDFVREELRAWREVTLNVVRPLRTLKEPISRRFTEVDDAFRLCGDTYGQCGLLRSLLFSAGPANTPGLK